MRALAKAHGLRHGAAWRAGGWRPSGEASSQAHMPLRPHRAARRLAARAGGPGVGRSYDGGSSMDSDASSSLCSTSSNGWLMDAASSPSSSASSGGGNGGQPYDAIMMLGGGLLPGGGLPEWVVRRLEGCLRLYQEQGPLQRWPQNGDGASAQQRAQQQGQRRGQQGAAAPPPPRGCPIVLLGAGTPHKPPVVDEWGYVLHESTAYAAYLMRRGVPAADLLKEAQSYDTVGNGYFSLLMHALPAGWRNIAVVTSDFHMLRTRATFDFIYGLAGRQLYGDEEWYRLDYRPVSDEGIFDADVLAARAEKEVAAVAAWQRNTAGMKSLADLHGWLYATHLCYSVSRQHEFGRERDLDPRLAATY